MDKPNNQLLMMLQKEFTGYHPVIAMAKMAHDETTEDNIKFNCHKEIARYIEPQLKSVEVKGSVRADFGTLRVVSAPPPKLADNSADSPKLPVEIDGVSTSPEAA